MTPRRRLLAVSHEANWTGAPIVLADLLEWIARHTDTEIHTLLLRDGPLRTRFEELGPVTALGASAANALLGPPGEPVARSRPGGLEGWAPRARRQLGRLGDFDVVHLNSAASAGILPHLPLSGPVVAHVHEMALALGTLGDREQDLLRTVPTRWIAASAAVRDDLVDVLGIERDRIAVHHSFIEAARFDAARANARDVGRLRRDHGIPDDAAVVMGSGAIEWRKGVDLFVQLAAAVHRSTSDPVHFVWVGGDRRSGELTRAWADCGRAGIRDVVHFVGAHPRPETWFAAADVFALTSHEDPFPLVCLEHAAMGHPVVTFRNGGIVEMVEPAGPEAASCVIPHLDVAGMAARVLDLLASEALRRTVGDQVRQRVLAHHDVSIAAPGLWADVAEVAR